MNSPDPRPLVLHIVYRFAVGGLENGLVNMLNRMPESRWRHAVLALTDVDLGMRARVLRGDVRFLELRKGPGHLWREYPRLLRLIRGLQPAIVHTRNLAALEAQVPARLAGVPVRIHGEHGWDVNDPDGRSTKFRLVRLLYRPFVQHYVALSRQIERYLTEDLRVDRSCVTQIYNGVDVVRFRSGRFALGARAPLPAAAPFAVDDAYVIGTVGRLQAVKDQVLLIRAFARVRHSSAEAARRLRLVIVGDGPLRGELERLIRQLGLEGSVWMVGERSDVPDWLAALDLFVLPSLSEGISNTILEAMACGRPVLATAVGGNPELVDDPATGDLTAPGNEAALADCLLAALANPERGRAQGAAGRRRIEQRFSLDAMVASYEAMYECLLARQGVQAVALGQA
jgi:sugar transferase (PEP-CTERM/EpsH1 system associated)